MAARPATDDGSDHGITVSWEVNARGEPFQAFSTIPNHEPPCSGASGLRESTVMPASGWPSLTVGCAEAPEKGQVPVAVRVLLVET